MSELSQVQQALARISPECSYDRWYRIAAAIYHALGDRGFEVFDEWSSKSDVKYPGHQRCRYQWNASKRATKIIVGTLFYYAAHPE